MPGTQLTDDATIRMLGVDVNLSTKKSSDGVIVSIPKNVRMQPPCRDAWTLKIIQ